MADIKIIVDSSDVATATNRVDQLGSSGTTAQKGINKATRGMNQFGAVASNGGKKLNTFNMQIQQGGYQLQDFVVQLQSGTSFFTAFGQQGSQFAGVFGPKGAVIGAVIAIGSAIGGIGYRALTAASAVKDFKEQLEDTSSVMEEYISLASKADETFSGLFDSSMSALSLTSQAAKDLLLIAKTDALNSIRGLGKSLSDASTEAGFWASVMFNTDRVVTGNLLNIDTQLKGNITTWKQTGQQVQAFIDAVRGIESAESLDGMYQSALLARDLFKETVDVTGEMTEKQKAFWKELTTTILKLEMMGAASQAIASTWADFDLSAFGGEGPDIEALTKAREEAEERVLKGRRDAGESYFQSEQAIQDAIHQVWVENNKDANDKRLGDIATAAKNRRAAGEAFFKQEQELEADIHKMRVDNILNEAALREATISLARAKFKAGAGQFGEASQDVAAQRLAELREAYANSLKPGKKGKKSDLQILREQLSLESALVGQTEARQRVIQALGVEFSKKNPQTVASLEKQIQLTKELIQEEQQRKDLIGFVADSMGDSFMSMVEGTKSVKDAFREMASDIVRELYRVLVVQQMVNSAKTFLGGFFADGGAFSGGSQIQAYADGGVIGSPTYFGMAGGKTGLMGEAGPEAIMPLTRGANGKLGVQAEGVGGVTINQNINISTGVQQTVRSEIKSMMPQIAEQSKAAVLDAKRRGGSYGGKF